MTDVIVRPEGLLAPGSDRRAAIAIGPGGSAANQAAWLAHFGVAVDLVARVGASDVAAESARLEAAGVTPHLAADSERESGRLIALIDPSGERSFYTDRGANDALTAADIPDALVAGASHIHVSGYSLFAPSPRAAVLDAIRRAGATPVSVDPASAEFLREIGRETFLALCRGAAMVFPNEEEAAVLTGSDEPEAQCARLAGLFPLVVLKLGALGCLAASGAERWRLDAPKSAVLDTTGAGDAFLAGFLAAQLRGETMETAIEQAVAAGSAAVTRVGGRLALAGALADPIRPNPVAFPPDPDGQRFRR